MTISQRGAGEVDTQTDHTPAPGPLRKLVHHLVRVPAVLLPAQLERQHRLFRVQPLRELHGAGDCMGANGPLGKASSSVPQDPLPANYSVPDTAVSQADVEKKTKLYCYNYYSACALQGGCPSHQESATSQRAVAFLPENLTFLHAPLACQGVRWKPMVQGCTCCVACGIGKLFCDVFSNPHCQ